jgi:hypothetical protein
MVSRKHLPVVLLAPLLLAACVETPTATIGTTTITSVVTTRACADTNTMCVSDLDCCSRWCTDDACE